MQTIRDRTVFLNGLDLDVWDRVQRLAPKSAPVRVDLFRRTGCAPAQVKQLPNAPPVHSSRGAQDNAAAKGLQWERFPVASARPRELESSGRFAARETTPSADAPTFDLLRTRLLQVLRANSLASVMVTAPSPGCGTTFTATNLALSLSRLASCRTVLIDLNFRSPGVASALSLMPTGSLCRGLIGEIPLTDCLVRFGANLMVGLADGTHPAPAELLQDPRTIATLGRLKNALQPDVIIYDLPPMLAYDDVTALLPQVDGVLLVADGTRTDARQITRCQDILADQTQLLGIALNKARDASDGRLRYGDR